MNILEAEIRTIKRSGELALIELVKDEESFFSLIIANSEPFIFEGSKVRMVFKETEVAIGKDLSGELSLRNRFVSKVTAIKKGELLSELMLDFKGNSICSVITTASVERMKIQPGEVVVGLVKTNELMLMQND